MFIRVKNHKNNNYAYLVKNKRFKTSSNPKQMIVKYLGKVIKPKRVSKIKFKEYINQDIKEYLEKTEINNIFLDLIKLELLNHDIKEINTKNIIIELNEGFLCNYTLQQLFNLKLPKSDKEASLILANTILSAGIKIQSSLFIKIFKKLKY